MHREVLSAECQQSSAGVGLLEPSTLRLCCSMLKHTLLLMQHQMQRPGRKPKCR